MTEKINSNATYFLAGLAIGSLISMFFAPKSGEGTRAYLSRKSKRGVNTLGKRRGNSGGALKTWLILERN
jgi:gas vesicle protein